MPMTFNPTNIAQHLGQLLQSELCPRPLMLSMHSFIHYGDLYSAPSRLLLRSAPDPCTAKKKSVETRVECVRKNPGEQSLRAWMSSNRLLLNPHKTQYIWLGTRQQLDKLDSESLSAEFPTFLFSTSVRDLGVILDQELSFGEHITALTRS